MEQTLLAILLGSRVIAEIGFFIADMCGKRRTSKRAKQIGRIAWGVARACSMVSGISDAYVRKRYQGRP